MDSLISFPFTSRTLLRSACIRSLIALVSTVALPASLLQGAEVTQSRAFSVTKAGSGTGTLVVVGMEGLVGTGFAPFDPSLGTLTSFSVKWDATVTTTATVSPSSTGGGGFTASIGGGFYLNSDGNGGDGGKRFLRLRVKSSGPTTELPPT